MPAHFLTSPFDILKENLTTAEVLLKKHDDFGRDLISQMDKLDELKALGHELVKQNHYDKDAILKTCEEVEDRYVLKEWNIK